MLAKEHSVVAVCKALGLSRSGYYASKSSGAGPRECQDRELGETIESIHSQSRGAYGYPRVRMELRRRGLAHSRRRVARLMRERGLKGRRRGKYKPVTTHSEHQYGYSRNLLKEALKETSSPMPEAWVCDTTYIATDDGWAYLAVTMDLRSRYILGWSLSRSNDTELCLRSLEKALAVRRPPKGFIVHKDRGSTYASDSFQDALRQAGALSSMSAKGNCYDNAAMESFFGTLKAECTFHLPYRDIEQASQSIFSYIEAFYNNRRLHSGIGYAPPVEAYRAMAA